MEELKPNVFDRVLPLFDNVRIYRALPLAVISGGQRGRIFADSVENPTVAFVSNVSGIYTIAGSTETEAFNQSLSQIVLEEIDREFGWCMLIPGSQKWAGLLEGILDGRIIKGNQPAVYFDIDPVRITHHTWHEHIPVDFVMKTIDGDLVDRLSEHYSVFKTWKPSSSFVSNGFGYCLLYGDEIASVCFSYSSVTPEGYVELGVRTMEKFRCQGLATLVCSAFIDQCKRNDLVPDWHTNSTNAGSIALAEKLGYKLVGDFSAFYYVESGNSSAHS